MKLCMCGNRLIMRGDVYFCQACQSLLTECAVCNEMHIIKEMYPRLFNTSTNGFATDDEINDNVDMLEERMICDSCDKKES